jgi:hypothetical protein
MLTSAFAVTRGHETRFAANGREGLDPMPAGPPHGKIIPLEIT